MHMESKRIETFDDWKDLCHAWQKDIDYDETAYELHLQEVLPSEEDRQKIRQITKCAGWIAQ
jgi:hypothetical protein